MYAQAERGTHQSKQDDPRRENEPGGRGGDDGRREAVRVAEGVRDLGERVVCRLEWVHGRGLRAREDEVKERDGERVVQRRAD